MNLSQGLLPFQLIEDASKVVLTSFGGLPLVMETFRALGLPRSIQRHLPFFSGRASIEKPITSSRLFRSLQREETVWMILRC
jgi:hypothetical protein